MIELVSEPSKHAFAKASFEGIYIIFKTTIYKDKNQKYPA